MSQRIFTHDEAETTAGPSRPGRRRGAGLRLPLFGLGVAGIALFGSLIGRGFAAAVPSDGTPIAAATAAAPTAPAPTGELAEVSAPPIQPALPTPSTGSETG